MFGWDPVGPHTVKELLEQHDEDCLWLDTLRDVQPYSEDTSPKDQTNATSPATKSLFDTTKPVNIWPTQGFNPAAQPPSFKPTLPPHPLSG